MTSSYTALQTALAADEPVDVVRRLKPLLNPRTIGILGASQRAARGTRVVRNLISVGFEGKIYPINPKYDEVLGLPCFPSVTETPEPIDSLVVAIPGQHVPGVLEQAFEAGVRAAVVLSSGFAEAGEVGGGRHRALRDLAARGMVICGPNCYGVFNVRTRAAAFSGEIPDPLLPGSVALISQSGGFSNMIANPLMEGRGLGFSYIISCGNQAGTSIEEYMEFLVEDPETEVIAAFVEGFREPQRLQAVAARAATLQKPIVVMKVGRSEGARLATLAHTGSLAGNAEIVAAILKQGGIIQTGSLNELMETTYLLSVARDRTSGWRLGVLTGSGGESGYVSDVAQDTGFALPELTTSSLQALHQILPDFANPRNPLDGTGAMYEDPTVFPRLMQTLAADGNVDVVAVNLGASPPRPGAWAPHREFSKSVAETARETDRLIVAYSSTIRGVLDEEIIDRLREAGVPYLEGTDLTLRAIGSLNWCREFWARADERDAEAPPMREVTLPSRSGPLSYLEARDLLAGFGLPTVPAHLVSTADEAIAAAENLGYPVVLKVESVDIVHKSDVGGVRVGLGDPTAVRQAFAEIQASVEERRPDARVDGILVQPMADTGVETILGIKHDPLLGPAIVFGLGGIFTEVLKDVAIRVPPIRESDADAMIREIRGRSVLEGARGRPPADLGALRRAIVQAGALAQALGDRLVALDLNPLLVLPEGQGVLTLDALVELR